MADATAPRARREDALVLGEGLPRDAVSTAAPAREPAAAPATPAVPLPLLLLWFGIVASLAAFLAFGSVRIGAGNWIGLRLNARDIWSRFIDFLVDEGASPAIVLGVTVAAAITLCGAAYVLWLAFALNDAPSGQPSDDPAER